MTEQLRQSLSAVVDGEADAFELRRVLDELDRDPELRSAWDRYHLIGSVIRGERTVQSRRAARALSRRVPLAVRQSSPTAADRMGDTVPGSAGGSAARVPFNVGMGRGRVGVALAASVALVAVIGFSLYSQGPSPEVRQVAVEAVAPATSQAGFKEVATDSAVSDGPHTGFVARDDFTGASPSDLRRTRAYMLQHAQQQGLEQRGVISLVKMAAYEAP